MNVDTIRSAMVKYEADKLNGSSAEWFNLPCQITNVWVELLPPDFAGENTKEYDEYSESEIKYSGIDSETVSFVCVATTNHFSMKPDARAYMENNRYILDDSPVPELQETVKQTYLCGLDENGNPVAHRWHDPSVAIAARKARQDDPAYPVKRARAWMKQNPHKVTTLRADELALA